MSKFMHDRGLCEDVCDYCLIDDSVKKENEHKLKRIEHGKYHIVGHPDITIVHYIFGWDLFYKDNVHPEFGTHPTLKRLKEELKKYEIKELKKI